MDSGERGDFAMIAPVLNVYIGKKEKELTGICIFLKEIDVNV